MALTGRLVADFSSFETAVSQAQVTLAGFQTGAGKVEGSLNRMASSLSGTRLIADATLITEAVARVGGASTLTATQMASVNTKVGEAIEKFRALGQEAPAAMLKLHTETSKVGPSAESASLGVGSMSRAFGVLAPFLPILTATGIVTTLVSLGRAAFDSAGHIVDLAHKTGLSTTAIQQMQAVANQTGTSVDAFTSAVFKLGVNVAEGSTKARDAVRDLGLSYTELAGLKPEDQFRLVIRALEDVESTQERNALGTAIFGRQFAEIAAAIAEGYSQIAEGASISTDAQLQALDRAGDAWTKFKDDVSTSVTTTLGKFVMLAQGLPTGAIQQLNAEEQILIATLTAKGATVAEIAAALTDYKRRAEDITLATQATSRTTETYIAKLAAARAEVAELTTAQLAEIEAAKLMGVSTGDLADQLGISETALRLVAERTREAKDGLVELTAAVDASSIVHGNAMEAWTREREEWERHQTVLPPLTGLLTNLDRSLGSAADATGILTTGLRFQAEVIETELAPKLETARRGYVELAEAAAESFRAQQRTLPTVNPTTGEGMQGTDPRVRSYLEQGYTLGEAMALAGGYGHYIGRPHGRWDETGWHETGARAMGGPVSAGGSYMVGERGPELFVPSSSGSILPHGAGGTTINVHINGSVLSDEHKIAAAVLPAVASALQRSGIRMPSGAA